MAGETWSSSDRLSRLRGLIEAPYGFDFHQALRRLECAFRELPRWGEAARPDDEPVRIGQEPSLAFAPSAVEGFEAPGESTPGRLTVAFFGLFGPNGPLPLHLTEYARERLRHSGDRTLLGFADIFHHRMYALFHRAWARRSPAAGLDRPEADRFTRYVGSLFGLGFPSLLERDALPDRAKLNYAALLAASPRSAAGSAGDDLRVSSSCRSRSKSSSASGWRCRADSRFRLGYSPEVSRARSHDGARGPSVRSRAQVSSRAGAALAPGFLAFAARDAQPRAAAGDGAQLHGGRACLGRAADPRAFAANQIKLGSHGRLGWDALVGVGRHGNEASDVIVDPSSHETGRVSGPKPLAAPASGPLRSRLTC